MQESVSFDITAGAAALLRRWVGTITWTRDLTTQIVRIRVQATRTEGTSNQGVYFYWGDAPTNFAVSPELRPASEQYPDLSDSPSNTSTGLFTDGKGYLYIWGTQDTKDGYFDYVTGDPVHEEVIPPTDSFLNDITAQLATIGVQNFDGYAATGAALPYTVTRPLDVGTDNDLALNGDVVGWNFQFSVYACGASVEASFNLALAVIKALQGAWVRGTTLSASMGYNGAEVEGHYESQVTVQLNQGGIQ